MLRGVLLSIDSLRSKVLLLTSRSFVIVIPSLIEATARVDRFSILSKSGFLAD